MGLGRFLALFQNSTDSVLWNFLMSFLMVVWWIFLMRIFNFLNQNRKCHYEKPRFSVREISIFLSVNVLTSHSTSMFGTYSINMYRYIYLYVYVHIYVYINMHICIYVYIYTYFFGHIHTFTYIYSHTCVYMHVYICTCTYARIYIYIYKHRP